jgi:hypothetical protein
VTRIFSRLRPRSQDDTGSSLILGMIMLIVVGSIVMGLTSMATNDLNNTTNFKSAQAMDSTLNTAAETAISNVRYNFEPQTLNVSPPTPCWVPATSAAGYPDAQVATVVDAKSYTVEAWCSTSWVPFSNKTRVVTVSLCPNSVTAINCSATPWLQAIVTFDDYAFPIGTLETAQCTATCGTGMTINGWSFANLPPSVTNFSPTIGSKGTVITITGSGFTTSSVVDFTYTKLTGNVILPATSVTVNSTTSITATVPALTIGWNYYVTVTSPTGSSGFNGTFS